MTTRRSRVARSALALFALATAGYIGAHANTQKRRAEETAVLRAIIDSGFTYALPGGAVGEHEVMLHDHFDDIEGERAEDVAQRMADSLPTIPRDLVRDFSRVAVDKSRIEPFELGRAKLHLLADSTLERFFGRHGPKTPGWEGFRRAYPKGGGIVSVSRVGLSRDGQWAMVYVGEQGDWLSGAGYLYVLRKEGGIWRIRHQQMLWVS